MRFLILLVLLTSLALAAGSIDSAPATGPSDPPGPVASAYTDYRVCREVVNTAYRASQQQFRTQEKDRLSELYANLQPVVQR
jgi:hypothetical protein